VGCFGGSAGFGSGANGSSSTGAGERGAAAAGGGSANGSSETGGNAGGWIGAVRGGGWTAAGSLVALAADDGAGSGGFASCATAGGAAGRMSVSGWRDGSEASAVFAGLVGSSDCRGRSKAGAGPGNSTAGELSVALPAVVVGAMTGANADGAISGARRGRLGKAKGAAGDVSLNAGCNVAEPNALGDAGAVGVIDAWPDLTPCADSRSTGMV